MKSPVKLAIRTASGRHAAAIVGKGVACWGAARISGISNCEAIGIGVLMNARGMMELVINIGLERGVISPEIFPLLTETEAFSILDPYLRLAGEGYRVLPFRIDEYSWIDIGKPEQLEEAERLLAESGERA